MPAVSKPHLLVVDDQREMARLLADALGDEGYAVTIKTGGAEAIAALGTTAFDLVLTDLRMEQRDGFDVLAAARELDPTLPVLVMTAFGSIETAIEAIKRGAFHYLTKPFRLDEVRVFVARALEERKLRSGLRSLQKVATEQSALGELIGRSPPMRALFDLVERVTASQVPVLMRGESGTGKELVARAIHFGGTAQGRGRSSPVNCAAIPATLLESELFGHVKGAFTGAALSRRGLFVEADGGTLFLDEIGDMAPALQAKLLRVLEDGELRPVGADAPSDGRRPDRRGDPPGRSSRRVEAGTFRADLFYRLNVVPVALPPLRERLEDLPLLVEHFVSKMRAKNPAARLERFSPEALARLARFSWPGNVRELENFVERCGVMSAQPVGDLALVEQALPRSTGAAPALGRPARADAAAAPRGRVHRLGGRRVRRQQDARRRAARDRRLDDPPPGEGARAPRLTVAGCQPSRCIPPRSHPSHGAFSSERSAARALLEETACTRGPSFDSRSCSGRSPPLSCSVARPRRW